MISGKGLHYVSVCHEKGISEKREIKKRQRGRWALRIESKECQRE